MSYSCPSGQTLSGNTCTQTTTSTQAGTPVYSCPGGYTLSGSSCSITTSSAATPVYGCSTGYTLSGTICSTTTTSTIAATPVYSCGAGGTLSGTTCSYVASSATTPVYGCPNGGTLSGTNCTGVGGASSTTAYVYLGGKLIAEHDSVAGVLYSHTDGLGSPVARTNAQGGIVAKTRFEAYGAVAQGFTPTGANSVGFTGHVNDADTLLVYMQQRYYDPVAGRFMSVDPVVTDGATGRSFGRYEYGNSNPYGFVDPNGMDSDEPPTGSHLKDGPACEINCQSSAGAKGSGSSSGSETENSKSGSNTADGKGERLRDGQRRHQDAVDQEVKDLTAAGYKIEGQNVLARIPGMPNRFYDVVATDGSGQRIGIEVKTTIGESFRINNQQMAFDVQALNGKAVTAAGPIQGVSYVGVSFGGSTAAYFNRVELASRAKAAGVGFSARSQ